MNSTTFSQNLIAGILVGSVYGLVALGRVTIYRCSGVVNFAQGALAMLGVIVVDRARADLVRSPGLPNSAGSRARPSL